MKGRAIALGLSACVMVLAGACGPDALDEADALETAESAATAASTYDFYPDSNYIICTSASSCPWAGESFEAYADGSTVECSSNSLQRAHLEVTSGCLSSRYAGTWRRGWTSTYNFRALSRLYVDGKKVGWKTAAPSYRAHIQEWQAGAPEWAGLHVFARYQTENDLYVASYRKDGLVTIKKKLGGVYTTLAQKMLRAPATRTWHTVKLAVSGDTLQYFVDGTLQLTAHDTSLTWGTTGVRTDYMDVYLDDWKLE
ncbi:hypothetical protein [Archangium violaceum]|uniref:Lipoprotein n=1 Tax=Archangium violaceum Cb vi76 TaxID=1406225 RepID=A0A084SLD7_9BACT|nr:hypothetical protein [Archangium violaceum]KFA89272.1 hypothetical protein Q664_35950 [Archangium violaceum Cb vi76]